MFRPLRLLRIVNFIKMNSETTQKDASTDGASKKLTDDMLIWVDCEMSGLNPDTCRLLEVACIITEGDSLNIVAEGPDIIIHQPPEVLNRMDEWCTKTHAQSGLTQAVLNSKISETEAQKSLLDFVRRHTRPGHCPLAGNSVHVDKIFLNKYIPKFAEHCHYRIVDVSTVKELCRRWYPEHFAKAPTKKLTHRALDDIKESIEELKYYKSAIFK